VARANATRVKVLRVGGGEVYFENLSEVLSAGFRGV